MAIVHTTVFGNGLELRGSSWRMRWMNRGKVTIKTIGSLEHMTLIDARIQAAKLRQLRKVMKQ